MKTPFPIIILIFVCNLIAGCTFDTHRVCTVDGNRAIDQKSHFVHLSLARPVRSGEIYAFPEDLNSPSRFAFSFVGKTNEVIVDSISGHSQYENRSIQPLELAYLTPTNAVFLPEPDCIENGHFKSGSYKISVFYTASGRNYTGDFHIDYKIKTKIKWIFFWDFYRIPR